MTIHPKNLLIVLAGVLVITLGLVGYLFYSQNVILSKKDNVTTSLKKQSTSDDVTSIESDLNTTDMNSIDSDLTNIQKEITP